MKYVLFIIALSSGNGVSTQTVDFKDLTSCSNVQMYYNTEIFTHKMHELGINGEARCFLK